MSEELKALAELVAAEDSLRARGYFVTSTRREEALIALRAALTAQPSPPLAHPAPTGSFLCMCFECALSRGET